MSSNWYYLWVIWKITGGFRVIVPFTFKLGSSVYPREQKNLKCPILISCRNITLYHLCPHNFEHLQVSVLTFILPPKRTKLATADSFQKSVHQKGGPKSRVRIDMMQFNLQNIQLTDDFEILSVKLAEEHFKIESFCEVAPVHGCPCLPQCRIRNLPGT